MASVLQKVMLSSRNAIRFCSLARWVLKETRMQRRFMHAFISPLLAQPADSSLDSRMLRRICAAATLQPIIGVNYMALLRGRQLSRRERKIETLIAAAAPLYDALFDSLQLSYKRLKAISLSGKYVPCCAADSLFRQLFDRLTELVPRSENPLFYRVMAKLHAAQLASIKQKQGNIELKRVMRLTAAKGGYATLLFATALNPGMGRDEQDALFSLGAWMQLLDDVRDRHSDAAHGFRTAATCGKSPAELIDLLERYRFEAFRCIRSLPYGAERIARFLFIYFVVGIPSLAWLRVEARRRHLSNSFSHSPVFGLWRRARFLASTVSLALRYNYPSSEA